MASRLQPAFWGGLFIGILSALPFVSALNVCCCLWVIAGGALTSYLLQERSFAPITAADGAVAGLTAGLLGAVLAALLGVGFSFMQGIGGPESIDQLQGAFPPEFEGVLDQVRNLPPAVWYIVPFFFYILVFPIFSMLGGLLGVAMFKRTPPPPPPPGTIEVLPPL